MYGTVLLLRCCCKLESCGTVLLFYCCKLRSYIVVLLYCCLFLCWLGKSSTVLFLVVSGKSSTVLAVLYCFFLTWCTNLRTRKQNETKVSNPASSFIARARSRSKIARAIRCSAVDIEANKSYVPTEA